MNWDSLMVGVSQLLDTLPTSSITLMVLSGVVMAFVFKWFVRAVPGGSLLRGGYYGLTLLLIVHPLLSHAAAQGLLPGAVTTWAAGTFLFGFVFHRTVARWLRARLI